MGYDRGSVVAESGVLLRFSADFLEGAREFSTLTSGNALLLRFIALMGKGLA